MCCSIAIATTDAVYASQYLVPIKDTLKAEDAGNIKPALQEIFNQNKIKIKIDHIKRLPSHRYQIFEINGSWVVRFSFADDQKIKQEKDVLETLLKQSLDVQIPVYQDVYTVIGKQISFVLYPKIPGEVLSDEIFQRLSDEEKHQISEDLASFMYKAHQTSELEEILSSETEEVFGGVVNRVPLPELLNEKMEYYLIDKYEDLLLLWTEVYRTYLRIYQEPRLQAPIHNDLHRGNLLIDPASNRLIGILDFEDVVNGHILREFRHFYSISPEFMNQVARSYAKKIDFDEEDFVQGAFAFRMYREFTNLWKVLEFPQIANECDYQSAATLREFMNSEFAHNFVHYRSVELPHTALLKKSGFSPF